MINRKINIVHDTNVNLEFHSESNLHCKQDMAYIVTEKNMNLEFIDKLHLFEVTIYSKWVQRFLKILGIEGKKNMYKGYIV